MTCYYALVQRARATRAHTSLYTMEDTAAAARPSPWHSRPFWSPHSYTPFLPKKQKGFERKKDSMPKIRPQTRRMTKERGNKSGKVGDYKCKRWVWWGKHGGGGMHGALMA